MSKTTKPENLSKEIMNYLENYVEDIEEGVQETSDELSKEAVKELKKVSPRRVGKTRKNPYWKGWSRKKDTKYKKRYVIKIFNKTNYQLTHLLEFGHATKNGKRTKAIPHIKKVEEKYNKLYEKEIKNVITRRSKK